MSDDPAYYMAIVRPENFEKLLGFDLSFYAVKKGTKIRSGDRIVLYRSRGRSARDVGPGIVGAFEVTDDPLIVSRAAASGDVFLSLYPTQIPWRALVTSFDKPLPIAQLVPELQIFTNKARYGSVLQIALKRLPRHDYELIVAELKRHRGDVL